jgi:hypothetical protein
MADGFATIIESLEKQKAAIDKALAALREVNGVTAAPAPIAASEPTGRKGKKRTAEQRKRMAEAQRLRYLRQAEPALAPEAPKTKPKFSPEARKKLALAMKKRWAVKRAEATVKKAKKGRKKAADNEVPF